MKRHAISIKHAYDGIIWALRTQPNYRIHFLLSLLAIVGGFLFQISYTEFMIVISLIGVGLTIETLNTSIEKASDAIDTKWREDLKITKDLAAGAMLFFAVAATIVAIMIYVPKILLFIHFV
ncbi:diacylglycerol kinase family protein [Candidatus Roizmanbacteria bacterium]|nr:diacylglycerol kinase family protein [Candidatus Roizmanbacteria bacterium]